MCEIIEKLQKESAAEAALKKTMEIALDILREGQTATFASIATKLSVVTKLSVETITQLAIDNNIAYTM